MLKSQQRGIMLSIIICVYNTQKELFKNCLNSIANSILENYEVVIIDDGSTIDYSDLIDQFKNLINLKYIKTKNMGTLSARLRGIQEANGEYICYVDSDDTISFCYHSAMINQIEDCDIIINDWAMKTKFATYYCLDDSTISTDIDSNSPLDIFFSKNGYEHSYYVLWNKIFKKEVLLKAKKEIEKSMPAKLVYGEDVLISYHAFANARHVKNTHLGFYFYHKHSSQEVAISSAEKLENQVISIGQVFELILTDLTSRNFKERYESNLLNWQQLICSSMLENAKQFKSKKTISIIENTFPNCILKGKRISNSKYIKKQLLPNNIEEIDKDLKAIYLRNSNDLIYCKKNSYTHKTLINMKCIFNLKFEVINDKNKAFILIKNDRNTLKQKLIHNYFVTKIGLILFPPSSKIRKLLKKKIINLN